MQGRGNVDDGGKEIQRKGETGDKRERMGMWFPWASLEIGGWAREVELRMIVNRKEASVRLRASGELDAKKKLVAAGRDLFECVLVCSAMFMVCYEVLAKRKLTLAIRAGRS
jgi:hypothetical protein